MSMIGTRVARVDRISVRVDAKFKTDERGFAQLWGTVISSDSLLEYGPMDGHPDGHLEFVPESTVFDEEAMRSLKNAPITFLHPAEPVTADNSVRVTVGHIIDVKRDGDRLRALHQIEDAQVISKIAGGVIELSPGYTTQLDDPEGLVVDGRVVDAIQSGRVYNHQAIVPEARAGHDNAFTIDARILPADGLRIQKAQGIMAVLKIDGKTVEVDADALAQIQKIVGGLGNSDAGDDEDEDDPAGSSDDKSDEGDDDDEETDKKGDADGDDSADDSNDSSEGDPPNASNDGATPKIDAKAIAAEVTKIALEAIRKDRKEDRAAQSRSSSIVNDARSSLPQGYRFEGRSDDQVMRAAIKERDPDLATRAKSLKGDALFGFFTATLASKTTGRTDSAPIVQTKHSYSDALEFRDQRIDAVAGGDETGDAAVRGDAALKLVWGGKG